jgi:phage terminase small subunit
MKMINSYIQEHYEDADDRIKIKLSRVYDEVEKNNPSNINNYFFNTLDLLCAQYEVFFMSYDALRQAGKVNQDDRYHRQAKNVNITVMTRASKEILDIMDKLSISPVIKAKVKKLNKEDYSESAEDLLNELIN